MTPQEEQLLNSLVERVNKTQLQEKDADAEALLTRAFDANPDAHYILAQTVLVQNFALEQAKSQVTQLQQQLEQARQQAQQQPVKATSFLGGLLGHRESSPQPQQGYTPVAQAQPAYGQSAPGYQPVSPYGQPGPGYPPAYPQQQYAAGAQPQFVPMGSGQPSFLRGAMQTAAGVAAGALAFEGVESLMHGFGGMGHSGFGGGMMGAGFGGMGSGFERPEETVINNYYDQPGENGGGDPAPGGEAASFASADGGHPWHDAAAQPDGDRSFHDAPVQAADQGGAQFENASYNTAGDSQASNDSESDDSGSSDLGSYDSSSDAGDSGDGGSGFDDGGGGFDDGGGGFGGDDGSGSF